MENLLSNWKYSKEHSIATLAYIATLKSNQLLTEEQEKLHIITYQSLEAISDYSVVRTAINLINNIETNKFLVLNNFKLQVHEKWFFQIVLLSSLRYCNIIFNKKNEGISVPEKKEVIFKIMSNFRPQKESLYILRVLDNILKKNKTLLSYDLAPELLIFSQNVATTPCEGFKHSAHSLSKLANSVLTIKELGFILDLKSLPLRGIETSELICYFKTLAENDSYAFNIVTKVIKLFSNNIENREGSFLYKSILFDDFSKWRRIVWPQFLIKFQQIDIEGEFFQSLIKYWIPQTVTTYKMDFYNILNDFFIPRYLKAHILLEIRKKGLFEEFSTSIIQDLVIFFQDNQTKSLALKIVSLHHKKNHFATEIELLFVKNYLYGQTDTLEVDEVKSLHMFLSQLAVVGSHLKAKRCSDIEQSLLNLYVEFIKGIFKFGSILLKTSRREIGAQILIILFKLKKNVLILNYNLVNNNVNFLVEILESKFLEMSNSLCNLIEELLVEGNVSCPELIKLGHLVLTEYPCETKIDLHFLEKFINKPHDVSIKIADIVRNITNFSMIKSKDDGIQDSNLFACALLKSTHKPSQLILNDVFIGVLVYAALSEVYKSGALLDSKTFLSDFSSGYLEFIENILNNNGIEKIFVNECQKNPLISINDKYFLHTKIQKIVEAFFNNVLQCILEQPKVFIKNDEYQKHINLLSKIIHISNMRRPTTLAAEVLKYLGKIIDENFKNNCHINHLKPLKNQPDNITFKLEVDAKDFTTEEINRNFKIQYLDRMLQELFETSSIQNLTIRRNPESRLIIHALCVSEIYPGKPSLKWTMGHLLNILRVSNLPDTTVSSCLHCLEIIISDNSLYEHTFPFVSEVILQCVKIFNTKSWVIRNANIQLTKALIDRFEGVLIGYNTRPKTVEDIFFLFPNLAVPFFQTVCLNPLTDSAVIVMEFFSESQIKRKLFQSEFSKVTRHGFLEAFKVIIKNCSDYLGSFAVRSYVSLCLAEDIPFIICDIVSFIIENFKLIRRRHTVSNFLLLLHELLDKYTLFIAELFDKPRDTYVIFESFYKLSTFFQCFNPKQFDLLLVKIISINDAVTLLKTSSFDKCNYEQRIWLNNYIPYVVINSKDQDLVDLLSYVLLKTYPDFLHIKILSILVEKYIKGQLSSSIKRVLEILVEKILDIDDNNNFLLLNYYKVVCLFFGTTQYSVWDTLRQRIRDSYKNVKSIYKTCSLILLLSNIESKSVCDNNFIKISIKSFQKINLYDLELAEIISEMLPYLYNCVSCVCDKYKIFKMATFLILEHGIWDFVKYITNSQVPSALVALVKILNFEVLSNSFGDRHVAYKFITEFYNWVNQEHIGKELNAESKTYFVEETEVLVDRRDIDKIVLKFLIDFNKADKDMEKLNLYKSLKVSNKI